MNWHKLTLAGAVVAGLGIAVSGCFVVSLSPWFGTEDVVEVKSFEGMWQMDDDEWLEVTSGNVEYGGSTVKGYKLQYRECGKKDEAPMFGVIGQVGKRRYLAYVSPEEDMDKFQGVAAHLLTQLSIEDDTLSIGHLSRQHLADLWRRRILGLDFVCAEKGGVRPPSRGEAKLCGGGPLLLTEDRASLKDFLVQNQDESKLFDKPEEPAKRISEPPCGKAEKRP